VNIDSYFKMQIGRHCNCFDLGINYVNFILKSYLALKHDFQSPQIKSKQKAKTVSEKRL
jgi:hypothetical protein